MQNVAVLQEVRWPRSGEHESNLMNPGVDLESALSSAINGGIDQGRVFKIFVIFQGGLDNWNNYCFDRALPVGGVSQSNQVLGDLINGYGVVSC